MSFRRNLGIEIGGWGFEDLRIWGFGDLGILGVDLETRKKIPYTLHTRLRLVLNPRALGRWADGPMGREQLRSAGFGD